MENNILNHEAARLAYEIAGHSHKPVDQVVAQAIRELAERVLPRNAPFQPSRPLHQRIHELQARVAKLPILDSRSPEEIIGYDEQGLPT